MSSTKTLHALLVGIDKYPIERHRLNGCVNDRNEFKSFLERHAGDTELRIKTLTDDEAKKKSVIEAFKHFEPAKNGDTCVFYFSGHGSRAHAPREFWHLDPDRMNESMVCWDSRIDGGKDLMDKEISYLLWKATQGRDVHFLAVFDCCHSGTITKDVAVTPRMAEPSPTPNTVQDYFGFQEYKKTQMDGETQYSPPRPNVVQLAASKESETAKELRINGVPRGIFTYNLIEALEQTGSQVSYGELLRSLSVRVANKVKEQTPQLITSRAQDKNLLFLGGVAEPSPPYFQIDYDEKAGEWMMNAGEVQGIPSDGGKLELEDGTTVSIRKVGINQSEIDGMDDMDKSKSYKAFASQINFPKIQVAFANGNEKDGEAVIRKAIEESKPAFLELIDRLEDATYWIRAVDNTLQLTLPDQERPVFRRVEGYTDDSATMFLNAVEHVAKWRNLIDLSNPRSSIRDDEFEITLYQLKEAGNHEDDDPAAAVDWREATVFNYDKIDGEWEMPAYRMKIKNTGNRALYVSAAYMSDNFGITNTFLPQKELNPGEEDWMVDIVEEEDGSRYPYRTIPLYVDDSYHSWGITEIHEFIKVFVSTDPELNTDGYNQEGLEFDTAKHKGAGRRKSKPKKHDWTVKNVELVIVRPMEEKPLKAEKSVDLVEGISITAPKGVSAKVSLSGLEASERSVFAAQGTEMAAPARLWGPDQEEAEAYQFTRGLHNSSGPSVLELRDVEGKEELSVDNPMILHLNRTLDDREFVFPMGYDQETGLYYPLGVTTQDGEVHIETLPDASPTGTRSLGGSIKIFFQKVLAKAGLQYSYPQLAMAVFEDENSEDFKYETDSGSLQEAVANANSIALFIHGIIGDTLEMTKSVKRAHDDAGTSLEQKYDLVLTFDYENLNTPIDETAGLLGERLSSVGLSAGHGKDLTIIAHSMGGLVSRSFIEKKGGNEVVSHLIQLGTPNGGSPWSDVYELASVLLARAINGATFLQPYILPLNFLGRYLKQAFVTLQQMDPDDSDFLRLLNDGTDPGIPYSIVAGNTQLIPAIFEEKQKGLLKKLVSRFKKRGHFDALDLLLFKSPNDIAVAVDAIEGIAGADQWSQPPQVIEVACDHISYFGDPAGLEGLAKAAF